MIRPAALVLAASLLAAPPAAAGQGRAADAAAIRALVVDQLTRAWAEKDADLWAAAYTPDSTFVNVFGAFLPDREANRRRHADLFQGVFAGSAIEQSLANLAFPADDVAIADVALTLTGYRRLPPWLATAIGAAQGERPPLNTRFRHVLARQADGAWRIVATQNTAVVANMPAR